MNHPYVSAICTSAIVDLFSSRFSNLLLLKAVNYFLYIRCKVIRAVNAWVARPCKMSSKITRKETPEEKERNESARKRPTLIEDPLSADSVTSSASSPSIQIQKQREGSVDCVLCATNNFLRAIIPNYDNVSPEIFEMHYKLKKYHMLEEDRIKMYPDAGKYTDKEFIRKIRRIDQRLKKREETLLSQLKTEAGYTQTAAHDYINNLLGVTLMQIGASKVELTNKGLNQLEFNPQFSNVILASVDINYHGFRVGHSLVFRKFEDKWLIIDSMMKKPMPISDFEKMNEYYLELKWIHIIAKTTQKDKEGGELITVLSDSESNFLLSKKYTTRFYFLRLPKRASKSVPALVCANSWALSSVHALSGFLTQVSLFAT